MNAIEKDLIAWTKAKIRFAACAFGPNLSGQHATTEEVYEARQAVLLAEVALQSRGMRLLRKEGKADAR